MCLTNAWGELGVRMDERMSGCLPRGVSVQRSDSETAGEIRLEAELIHVATPLTQQGLPSPVFGNAEHMAIHKCSHTLPYKKKINTNWDEEYEIEYRNIRGTFIAAVEQ